MQTLEIKNHVPKQDAFFLRQESVSLLFSLTTQKVWLLKKVINFTDTNEKPREIIA